MPGPDPTRAHARRTDPQTSHDAARSITPDLTRLQVRVLRCLATHGAMIDPKLSERLGDDTSTVRSRRAELVVMKLVHSIGTETRHKSRRKFTVWAATQAGHRVIQEERNRDGGKRK